MTADCQWGRGWARAQPPSQWQRLYVTRFSLGQLCSWWTLMLKDPWLRIGFIFPFQRCVIVKRKKYYIFLKETSGLQVKMKPPSWKGAATGSHRTCAQWLQVTGLPHTRGHAGGPEASWEFLKGSILTTGCGKQGNLKLVFRFLILLKTLLATYPVLCSSGTSQSVIFLPNLKVDESQ